MYVLLGRNLWTCFAKDDPRAGLQVTEAFACFLIILCCTMMGWCRSEIPYAKAKYQNLGCYIFCLFVFNVCLWLEILSGHKKGTLDICPMYPGGLVRAVISARLLDTQKCIRHSHWTYVLTLLKFPVCIAKGIWTHTKSLCIQNLPHSARMSSGQGFIQDALNSIPRYCVLHFQFCLFVSGKSGEIQKL